MAKGSVGCRALGDPASALVLGEPDVVAAACAAGCRFGLPVMGHPADG